MGAMNPTESKEGKKLLVLNVGSSSLKYQLFAVGDNPRSISAGNVARNDRARKNGFGSGAG